MNKLLNGTFTAITLAVALPALAKAPEISGNTSGINDAILINNVAAAAIGSGAKEPIAIGGNISQLVITGSNGTTCTIPLDNGKMKGISCK